MNNFVKILTFGVRRGHLYPVPFNSRIFQRIPMRSCTTEKTCQYEDKLPSLPVPSLKQSCEKYLQSVEPHLTQGELKNTQRIVEEFYNGQGKELQEKLVEKHLLLETGQELPVDKMGKIPLCMNQYYRLFGGCRLPGKHVDSLNDYFQTAPLPCPGHLVVLVRGRIYKCQVLDEQMEPFTVPEIKQQLQEIVDDAKSQAPGPSLGVLTSENRTVWWKLRERLLQSNPKHQQLLDDIQTSIFVLVLDVKSPCNSDEILNETLLGDCMNRWFDKSYQLLAFANGTFGCNMEHAPFEAIIQINMIVSVLKEIQQRNGKVWNGSEEIRSFPKPKELQFDLDQTFHQAIDKAVINYTQLANKVGVIAVSCEEFGKAFSKQHSIHPDTFMQLALQLTYYRMYKRPACTYETAQTRQFHLGRTETVRSCTSESTSWSKAMLDSNVNQTPAFRQASDKHNQLMREATNAQGMDRHFMGLQMIAAEQGLPTPEIFQDKAWKLSGGGGNFVLSTSVLGYSNTFGSTVAMVENGYGAFYSIEDNCFNMCITDWKTCPDTDRYKFYENLCVSLRDMKTLLVSAAKL